MGIVALYMLLRAIEILLIEKLSFITANAVAKIPNNVTNNKLLWDFDMGKYHVNNVCIK